MSDFSMDLNSVYGTQVSEKIATNSTNKKAGSDMVMDDFLKLMVAQFQNQSIDSTADTTEMMNQMVQMSVIQAITNLSTLVTDTTNLSYAASLVGKDVTIGERVGSQMNQIVGTVTGTGTMDGKQVLFLDNKQTPYNLTDILAVGSIPKTLPKTEAATGSTTDNESPWQTTETGAQEQTGSEQASQSAAAESGTSGSGEHDPHTPDENGALG